MILIFLVLLIIGILEILFPEEMFMFGRKWEFKEGTGPSDISILFTRIGGIVLVIMAIIFAFACLW
ncbi:hypothetical protein KQI89_10370 [Clostridium sp. MSJ-4]|uniref:DUF6199 domain-containing protein n=1 Tax=Clostridium simiarum TaxID=2841506 RepID=A0ABS6F1A0_9CLOT|nr:MULTISPECIES: DUF6199 family natural product biosynthesis protein [Clostridium]MBU5592165.1 hypothetical protein [Clostridium simiarum]